MAEVVPAALAKKRNEAQIAQFEATLAAQELEVMEKEDQINKLLENIEATRKQIATRRENIAALERDRAEELRSDKKGEEVTDG